MTTRRKGEVWLALFPHSDLRTAKLRPVLVVQDDKLTTGLDQTIVAMISGNLGRLGPPSRFRVEKASAEGNAANLRVDSVVLCDHLMTVGGELFHRRLGALPSTERADQALRAALGL